MRVMSHREVLPYTRVQKAAELEGLFINDAFRDKFHSKKGNNEDQLEPKANIVNRMSHWEELGLINIPMLYMITRTLMKILCL